MKLYAEINLQNKIVPVYDSDYEVLKKLKKNTPLSFEIKQERNYKFLKKFFALINMVFENQEHYKDIDRLREDLTIQAGYYYEDTNFITGEVVTKAKSIAFANMTEEQFSSLYESLKNVVIHWLGITDEEIKENIEQFF